MVFSTAEEVVQENVPLKEAEPSSTTTAPYNEELTTAVFEATLKCEYNEKLYMEGEEIPDSEFCSNCRCEMGNVTCQERRCPGAPSGSCETIEDPWNCCPTYKCSKCPVKLPSKLMADL